MIQIVIKIPKDTTMLDPTSVWAFGEGVKPIPTVVRKCHFLFSLYTSSHAANNPP